VEIDWAGLPPHAFLFGEDPSRAVVSFKPASADRVKAICAEEKVPFSTLGAVGGDGLEMRACFKLSLAELDDAWRNGFTRALGLN
jgi:hypothetical protein